MNPHKTLRNKIEFYALGQNHVAYSETHMDQRSIEFVISLIAATAALECLSTDLVAQKEFEEFHISNIVAWKHRIDDLEQNEHQMELGGSDEHLPDHYLRCDNHRCSLRANCKRYLSTMHDVMLNVLPRPQIARYAPNNIDFPSDDNWCEYQIHNKK